MMARLLALIPALFLLLLAVSARAETEADLPRDPDFYYTYDPATQEPPPVPMPDLASRPKPRDSREFDGEVVPDPQGTLRFFVVGGASSSTCIGAPVSPLCAIETVFAGLQNHSDHLLAIGSGSFSSGPQFDKAGPADKGRIVIYRVYDVKRLGTKDLKEPRPYGVDPWYPRWFYPENAWRKDDLQVQILYMQCRPTGGNKCSSRRVPVTYTVRKVSQIDWAVVTMYVPKF